MSSFRIGCGFDVHAFCDDRKLALGGIEIPFEKGLAGHSDADVALHAIADALLGAAGLGDIGEMFPDSDPEFKDADSGLLLSRVMYKLRKNGFDAVFNVDLTIILQRPRLTNYKSLMRGRIASILGVDESVVNIKATTTEKLGFTGREEGIAAMAVCLIAHND